MYKSENSRVRVNLQSESENRTLVETSVREDSRTRRESPVSEYLWWWYTSSLGEALLKRGSLLSQQAEAALAAFSLGSEEARMVGEGGPLRGTE